MRRSIETFLWSIAGLVGFFTAWSVAALLIRNEILMPQPVEVAKGLAGVAADGSLLKDIFASLKRVVGGFAIASVLAIPLALAMAYSRQLNLLFSPLITFLRPIPPIAWMPIAILWFGIGDPPSFSITALAAFFPIFLNTYTGGRAVRAEHLNAAKSLGAKSRALFFRIYLPSAMPMIATGLRIGLGQSWMAVVTAELVAAQSGLGFMIQANRLALETPLVLADMCVIGLLGAAMSASLELLERKVLVPWR